MSEPLYGSRPSEIKGNQPKYAPRRTNGSNTSSSASSSSGSTIQMDTDVYKEIVDNIDAQRKLIIDSSQAYTDIDEKTKNNSTVPTFVDADHDVVDMLKDLKKQILQVVTTMRTIRENYISVDDTASASTPTYTNK